jgi:hypothetical protein
MSGLLFGIGAVAVVVGAVMVGFGIPINEFSFGNTLIVAGTTAAVGGLVIIGLGVVVAQLQRINEALAEGTPIRPVDEFESAAGARAVPVRGRVPFPPKPKIDARLREPHPIEPSMGTSVADMPVEEHQEQSFAPTLRNPDEPPVTVEDDVSLSPQHPMAAPAPAADDLGAPAPVASPLPSFDVNDLDENRQESRLDADWPALRPSPAPEQSRQPHSTYFDAMWPPEPTPARILAGTEAKSFEPKFDLPPREAAAEPVERAEPEAPAFRLENEPRSVAILKSGVVDGMGYTLYVDGSIEAELPQGTLRFASINELRSHLEQNS